MKRVFLLLLLSIFIFPVTSGQLWKLRRYEIYAGLGSTQLLGDIGGFSIGENALGFKDVIIKQTRFNIKAGMRYRPLEKIGLTFDFNFGLLHSSDERGSNINRGFESSTILFEPLFKGEYYFLKNNAESSYRFIKGDRIFNSVLARLDGYVYTGLAPAIYKVNPNEVLSTRIEKDSGVALAIPLGLGFNYLFSPNSLIGLDFGLRYTTSDYIDGYTSQFSSHNDVYYFMTFVFTQKLKTSEKGLPTFRK
ncbi:MAG TPA: hypothetical protein DEQ09_00530 [Bacteroidales bacterium]|nr:hypothetical protein [Bacteroidales bacterium]